MLLYKGRQITHVIWDFNGTVLDDMQAGIDSVNEMLAARGLPVLRGISDYRRVFCFPVREYYRRLGFDFEKEDYDTVLAPLWVRLYREKSATSPLFPGVRPLLEALRAVGASQTLLSATEQEMLREQLLARGAMDWFDEVWGTGSIHAHGKLGLAAAWRAAHPDAVPLMIGDTTHDAEVAREIGAACVLVASGCHSRAALAACGVPVVEDLFECRDLLLRQD